MQEFLDKYIFIEIKKDIPGMPAKILRHKCAKVTNISDTHISLFDTFDNQPYFYRIADIVEIKISNKIPGEEIKDD